MSLPPGLPLGLGEAAFRSGSITLPPGAVLALYTDGLVESRTRTFDEGIDSLRAMIATSTGPLPVTCDAIVDRLRQHGEDDTTLVLVRRPELQPAG